LWWDPFGSVQCVEHAAIGQKDQRVYRVPHSVAAALVVSVTMFMMWLAGHDRELGPSRFFLAGLMVLLSILMVSNVRYPTFKYMIGPHASVAAFAAAAVVGLLLVSYSK